MRLALIFLALFAGCHDNKMNRVAAPEKKLPPGFTSVRVPPFIVIGDGGEAEVREWAEGTVTWAVTRLQAEYFPRLPEEELEIWLFKDTHSYRKHTRELWGHEPGTPYGYYSTEEKALIMNIATGGGTLVHELVHPFVATNFPEAPAWLNEGLGSLYEQSSERGGRIVGLTNWRLAGLKEAIRAGELRSLESLLATSEREFYGERSGANYAQARYLLYYLQEKGLLRDFYHRFHDAHEKDPTGVETLKAVLGEKDLAAFQKRWEEWVLGLRFEG